MSLLLLLSGSAAAPLTCSGGSLLLEGSEVNFIRGRVLSAETQPYNEDLKPANLTRGRVLSAETQTYNEDLKPANLNSGRVLLAETQTYNEDLKSANLILGRVLSFDNRFFIITPPPQYFISIAYTQQITINPPAGYGLHTITDLSQVSNPNCIYYGLSPSIGDQILYKTTTETNAWTVTVSSTGIVSTSGSGTDTIKFRRWTPSVWSAELTYNVVSARILTAEARSYTLVRNDANLLKNSYSVSGGSVYRIKTEINGPALFTDTITQANGTILGDTTEWDRWNTTTVDTINSNGTNAFSTTANRASVGVIVGNTTFGPDQWAEHVHQSNSGGRWTAGPLVRASSGTTTNGYSFLNDGTNGETNPSAFRIVKHVNSGTPITIATSGPQGFGPIANSTTYTMRLEVIGDRLFGYIDGKLIVTARDSTFTTGQPGFQIIYGGSTISFSAGQIAASNSVALAQRTLTCAPQSYAVTSNDANLLTQRTITSTPQSYALATTQTGVVYSRYIYIFCDSDVGSTPTNITPNTSTSKYHTNTIWPANTATWLSIASALADTTLIAQTDYITFYIRGVSDFAQINTTALVNARSITIIGDALGAVWDNSKATIISSSGGNGSIQLGVSVPQTLKNIQVDNIQSTGTHRGVYCVSGDILLDNLKIRMRGTSTSGGTGITGSTAATSITVNNCIVDASGATTASSGVSFQTVTVGNIYNSVFRGANTGATNGDNIVNCAFFGFATQGGTSAHYKYCATVNNTGSNPVIVSDWNAAFVDYANFDYRLKAASPLIGVGIGPSSDPKVPTADIFGNVRSGTTCDLGAANYVSLGVTLTLATATLAITPNIVGLIYARRLAIEVKTFAIATSTLNLLVSKKLVATLQTYAVGSTQVTFLRGLRVPLTAQAFTLTGPPTTNILRGRILTAVVREYNIIPSPAGLLVGRKLTAATQLYDVTRNPANILIGRKVIAVVQNYSIGIYTTTFTRALKLSATQQSYSLLGVSTAIFKIGVRVLIAESLPVTLTRNPATLVYARRVTLTTSAYNCSPAQTNVLRGRRLTLTTSTYSYSPSQTNILWGRRLTLTTSTYSYSPSQTNVLRGTRIVADTRLYSFSSSSTNLIVARKLTLTVYNTNLTRNPTNLLIARRVGLNTVALNIFQFDTKLLYGRRLVLLSSNYALTFNIALLSRGGYIKVWTGSAWVSKPLKTWNGTAWVSKPLKVWTGSTWRTY